MQLIVRLLRLAADWASDRAHNTTLWGSRVSMDDTFRVAAAIALASRFDLPQLLDGDPPKNPEIRLMLEAYPPDQWREMAGQAAEDIGWIDEWERQHRSR